MKSGKSLTLLAGGLACLALGIFLKFRAQDQPLLQTVQSSLTKDMAPIVEKSLTAMTEGQSLEQALSPDEFSTLRDELKRSDPMYLERKILSRNVKLAQFRRLHLKLVKKAEEENDYHSMLRDEDLLNEAVMALNREYEVFNPEDQIERMIYVDWLSEAISVSVGQDAQALHRDLAKVIQSRLLFDQTKPLELRKSQYVDRMEIFRSYARAYPKEAMALLQTVPDSKYKHQLVQIMEQAQS